MYVYNLPCYDDSTDGDFLSFFCWVSVESQTYATTSDITIFRSNDALASMLMLYKEKKQHIFRNEKRIPTTSRKHDFQWIDSNFI